MYKNYIKRFLDFSIALLAILLLSPVFIVLLVLLAIANQGKPFFIQRRPGKDEKIFSIIKFKTMNDKTDDRGNPLPDGERITVIGNIVRKTSLDEIPQLINVLKGDMGLVGPRPLLISYLKLYNQEQRKRHHVRPGITGWAQVNGRNAISWEQKFEYDIWYVEHCSFLLDLKILWLTAIKVIKREDISSSTHATVERFKGTPA